MSGFTAEATAARAASRVLAATPTETKNRVLRAFADQIAASSDTILAANKADMERARANGLAAPKLKRLELSASSVAQLASGLRQVAELPDPVGIVSACRLV